MAVREKSLRANTTPKGAPGWNELGFVPWQSFRRMAPSILMLEISRLADLIASADEMEFRNALVKSRYELQAFIADLEASSATADSVEMEHLQAAILNLPVGYPDVSAEDAATLAYILDRLEYVHNRIRFVYH